VLDELAQHYREVAWAGDQQVIEAFAAQGADKAFSDGVDPRRANWSADDADVGAGEHLVECGGELAVPVTDQEPKLLGVVAEVHEQVAGLLGDPGAVDKIEATEPATLACHHGSVKGGRGVQGHLRAMRENDVTGLTEWNPMVEVG
jgi:hypothetical protein